MDMMVVKGLNGHDGSAGVKWTGWYNRVEMDMIVLKGLNGHDGIEGVKGT